MTKYSDFVYCFDNREGGAVVGMVLFINNKKQNGPVRAILQCEGGKMKRKLMTRLFQELHQYKKVSLCYRPIYIKFDESHAIYRMDLDSHNGFSVADKCRLQEVWPSWHSGSRAFYPETITDGQFLILGFFELTGKIKKGDVEIKEIFCALGQIKDSEFDETAKITPVVRVLISDKRDSIVLFWTKGLEKV